MTSGRQPTYDLSTVQALIAAGSYLIRESAFYDAMALGFDRADIEECILSLTLESFYKTMPAEKKRDLMQDVYKATYSGVDLYVKVQLDPPIRAVVISFKKE